MKKWLVALQTGGLMEDPTIRYENFQIIQAETAEEAEKKYNEVNEYTYFYGHCFGQIENGKLIIRE